MLTFDLYFFKRINDAHGHSGGGAVLIEVARRLRAGVRSWDVVSRAGGEEFCIIAPEIEDEDAIAELADRLRTAIAERAIILKPGVAIQSHGLRRRCAAAPRRRICRARV